MMMSPPFCCVWGGGGCLMCPVPALHCAASATPPDVRDEPGAAPTIDDPALARLYVQVLVVSEMHRTESAMDPSLFQYHQHFESPWHLVGKTHLSEVRLRPGCASVGCDCWRRRLPSQISSALVGPDSSAGPPCVGASAPPLPVLAGVPCSPPRERGGLCSQALPPPLPLQAAAGALPAGDTCCGRAALPPQHRGACTGLQHSGAARPPVVAPPSVRCCAGAASASTQQCHSNVVLVPLLPACLPWPLQNQYRAWQEGGHFYIQMDFCEGGTLAHRAHKVLGGRAGAVGCSKGSAWSMQQTPPTGVRLRCVRHCRPCRPALTGSACRMSCCGAPPARQPRCVSCGMHAQPAPKLLA